MSKNKSLSQLHLEKWISSGKYIPVCVNPGCDRKVAVRHWSAQGDPSLKTECSSCSRARIKNIQLPGITFHKKDYCENNSGKLGFICPIIPERYSTLPADIYQMDHVDGNHHNNDPDNLMTLCCICHAVKGREHGDFNSQKKSSRIKRSAAAADAATDAGDEVKQFKGKRKSSKKK